MKIKNSVMLSLKQIIKKRLTSEQAEQVKMLMESVLFDAEYYASRNPDLVNDSLECAIHYCLHGADEGRLPSEYFEKGLFANFPDIFCNPFEYILEYESNSKIYESLSDYEKISILNVSGLFDEEYYLDLYLDVKEAGIPAAAHFYYFGAREGRMPHANISMPYYSAKHKR